MEPEALTLPGLVAHRAHDQADVAFMVHDDDTLTFGELDERSRIVARGLIGEGVGPGARVGLLAPNGIEWAVTAIAAMRIGATLVPLSTLLKARELVPQLRAAEVEVLVVASEHRGRRPVDELDGELPGIAAVAPQARHPGLPNLRRLVRTDSLPSGDGTVPLEVVDALAARVTPGHDLVVLFTSGSRGAPKGVIHTHGGAIRATAAGLDIRGLGAGDRLYIPMPFFWTGGFGPGLLSVLVAGATLLTETDPTPASTIRFLEREQATLFRGWPDQAARIAADPSFAGADLSSLRSGSLDAVLPAGLRSRPGARSNIFGMTETFGPYAGDRLDTDMPTSAWGSCGRPIGSVEVRIVDPETGVERPVGEQGEIEVRGPDVMRGMVGRARSDVFTLDGWYRTGDLGHVDGAGYLFYGGRADDMFKVSGATVYPIEVEAGLRTIPFVRQAFATDVEVDGAVVVGAMVTLVDDPTDHPVAELHLAAKAALSSFKVPRRWVIAASPDEVPMLASGKVDKAALQALIVDHGIAAP